MPDTIEVGTDWQSIAERDPKDVAAEIDRLRAALKPFAWMADQYSPGTQDDFIVGVAIVRLRDAREALK